MESIKIRYIVKSLKQHYFSNCWLNHNPKSKTILGQHFLIHVLKWCTTSIQIYWKTITDIPFLLDSGWRTSLMLARILLPSVERRKLFHWWQWSGGTNRLMGKGKCRYHLPLVVVSKVDILALKTLTHSSL